MVGAAYGAWHYAKYCVGVGGKGRLGSKERGGKNGCHAGILHSHFNGYGALFRQTEMKQSADVIAEKVARRVVAEHYRHGKEEQSRTAQHQLGLHLRHHTANDECKGSDAHSWHGLLPNG